MGQSLSRQSNSLQNRFLIFPLTTTRNHQSSSEQTNNIVNQEHRHGEPPNSGFGTPDGLETGNSMTMIDGDRSLWDNIVILRARREVIAARLRLFVRISIIFVVLILVLGVDPLHLPWWLVFIPMILMILNLAYIAVLKNRIRAIDREEVSLQQSMGCVEMGQELEATYLPPPPPTYATAAAEPPAYLNPLITPSYASLLPSRTSSNLNLGEQTSNISQHSNDNNHISIEMTQASSSSAGLVASTAEQRKIEESS